MTPEQQETFDRTTNLVVRVYKSLHLRAPHPESDDRVRSWKANVDAWIDANKYPPDAIEGVVNHIHICDRFPDVPEKEYTRLADEIARAWERKLAAIDARYKVVRYEGYGPEVTFYLDRTSSPEPP